MDEMKGKVKGFIKKINKPFAAGSSSSSSSSKFKGQGRVLGSSDGISQNNGPTYRQSATPLSNHGSTNPPQNNRGTVNRTLETLEKKTPEKETLEKRLPVSLSLTDETQVKSTEVAGSDRKPDGFDPFDTCISSRIAPKSGTSLDMFQCPVCNDWFKSEQDVSAHVENCLENNQTLENESSGDKTDAVRNELANCVGTFLSGNPTGKTLEVVLKLLKNIGSDPTNDKFRRIRMSNPKIQETVGMAVGGAELLEFVGFKFQAEGEDMWAVMETPSAEGLGMVTEAISLLEPHLLSPVPSSGLSVNHTRDFVEPRKIDRQLRVFFAAPESMAARIELPDSFYQLSAAELKREAESRKKKLEDSQLLIPKSFRDKQAKAARKRYKATIIRIQFPDGVILQGVFLPLEPATVLYEFVRLALKEASLEFELLGPAVPKSRVIPHLPKPGEKMPTLEDEDLVPAALVKFKPIETDSVVFTGLCNELLAVSEPLTPEAFPKGVEFKPSLQGS